MNWKFALLSAVLVAGFRANAADLSLGIPEYGGTGCPMGSASVTLGPDSKSISILFDQYVVEAGGDKSFDRKNCNIAIPVTIPQGYSVSIFAIDYRGFTGIPSGGRAQLSVDYFLAGMGRGVRTTKTFSGPMSSDYLKSDSLEADAVVWSACGASTILRANTTMLVQSNRNRDQAMATVDSADVNAGLIYHVQWRQCR
jgi:hypothetical protein